MRKKRFLHKVVCTHCGERVPWQHSSYRHPLIQLFLEKYPTATIPFWCDTCMEEEGVIVADWQRQKVDGGFSSDAFCILYYVDEVKTCVSCKEEFVFTASEKQFWYEEAQIFIEVSPKMCLSCRREAKKTGPISQQIALLLQEVAEQPSREKYLQLASLYEELGNKTKAGQCKADAKRYP
ncbi:MAG: zinc-ribbon domain containing protein [Thermonemataceae bacterium]